MDIDEASYGRKKNGGQWTYDDLMHVMTNKEALIEWLMTEGLHGKSQPCPHSSKEMKLMTCNDQSDGLKWDAEYRQAVNDTRPTHQYEEEAGFHRATLEEILKFTYWWCQDLEESQIMHELQLARGTGVDWNSFCREV